MSRLWIGIALTAPMIGGFLAAYLFWRPGRDYVIGNAIGSGVIFAGAVAFMSRESLVMAAIRKACLDRGTVCFPHPGDFNRYCVYIGIAFAQVMTLFVISLRVEERKRRRSVAREWR